MLCGRYLIDIWLILSWTISITTPLAAMCINVVPASGLVHEFHTLYRCRSGDWSKLEQGDEAVFNRWIDNGGLCSSSNLIGKSIVKNVDIKPDPINSTVSFACISWPREIEVVVKQDLASWRNFNSSEVPTREICVVGCELPGLKTQEQPFAALPVLLPQPLCHSFNHPVKDMKAGTLEMASAQVYISDQSYINIWALRRREDSLLAVASTSPGRGSTIYVTIAKSLGGQRLRTGTRSSIEILP